MAEDRKKARNREGNKWRWKERMHTKQMNECQKNII
jgi:hypothetical protein